MRHEAGLARAVRRLAALAQAGSAEAVTGLLVATAALRRRESRGAHWRADHPGQRAPRSTEITLSQAFAQAASVADAAPRPARLQEVP